MEDISLQTYLSEKPLLPLEGDLDWLLAERQANRFFRSRKVPMRFTFWWVSADVLEVKVRQHPVAVYVRSTDKLYRVDGSLTLHWQLVQRALQRLRSDRGA